MGLSLAGPTGVCLGLRALRWFACVDPPLTRPVSRTARPSTVFRVDAVTAPFGSEDATPRSRACVRVRAPFGRVGRAGLPGAFRCASFFPVAGLGALFFFQPSPGCGCPFCGCCWVFLFLVARRCLRRSVIPGPGCPGPWRLVVLPPAPPFFFAFSFFFLVRPLVFGSRWFPARRAVGLGTPWSSCPAPPIVFLLAVFLYFVCFLFFFLILFRFCLFFLFALECRLCGAPAGLCVLCCGVCWCVLLWASCPREGRFALALCRWVLPGCACSVCAVACRVALLWCVLCFAQCCVACLCLAWILLLDAAPCCRCLVPCCGPWLCFALGYGAALLWCAACRAVCCRLFRVLLPVPCCFVHAGLCCVLLPVVAGCSLLGPVACCCFPLARVVAGAPAWPRGLVTCCVLWFVLVPRSPVLCSVFCGAVLPCGAVLWRPAVRFPLLVASVCVLCLCERCCAALCVVLFDAGLVCAVSWCLVLWCVAVCCGVSLGILWCGGAALVCCGVLLCRAVFCGAVSPCAAVLLGCAVCFRSLRVFLFSSKTIVRFLKLKVKKNKNKIKLYPTHACRQAARSFRGHCLTCHAAASTLTASSLSSFVFFPVVDLT